jgi:hypothetical protein
LLLLLLVLVLLFVGVVGGVVGTVAVVVDGGDEGLLIRCHQRGRFVVLVLFVVLKNGLTCVRQE